MGARVLINGTWYNCRWMKVQWQVRGQRSGFSIFQVGQNSKLALAGARSGGTLVPMTFPLFIAYLVTALALLIGQQGWRRSVPIAYVIAVLLGLGAIAMAYTKSH